MAAPLFGQTPTPEGTVITNMASVSFTDANGNTYTPVTASVAVTVGFTAGVDVTGSATVTPASPSTGNELGYTIGNTGNGTDQFSVAVSPAAGLSVTGYKIGATPYATLALLNTALDSTNVLAAANVVVTVVYDVAAAQGGATLALQLTATSVRTVTVNDPFSTNVMPPVAGSVTVVVVSATASRLPSNGTQYTASYTVTNTGNASTLFDLAGSVSSGTVTIVSVNGTAGSASTVTLAAGANASVSTVYTVADVAAGLTADVTLTSTKNGDVSVTANDLVTVTVIRAALTMAKVAFRADQTTVVAGTVLPGETIWYRITVTNSGTADAATISVTDALPAEVTYVSSAGDAAGWTLNEVTGTVTGDLTGTLATTAARFFWIRVTVK
ncbi:MAG TPA: hypothetical protein VMN60_07280 [Longimicrobiales bacterium]|nr:hypothetical protein [Longimicrobiales bacterium]